MGVSGIILSGGKSTRMGMDKGLIELKGKPMIQHVIDHIDPICNEILISANDKVYENFSYPVYNDEIHEIGPAGGIISCLKHSSYNKNIIIPTNNIKKVVKEMSLASFSLNILNA